MALPLRARFVFALACASSACASLRSSDDACHVDAEDRGSIEAARRFLETCGVEETIELTRRLVAFPTVSAEGLAKDNPAFREMRRFLEAHARDHDLDFQAFGDDDAWELGMGQGQRRLGYVMHADVVPAGRGEVPEGWSGPPFSAWVRDGKLYGRGTEDDKGPIAAVLVAMSTLRRFGLVPNARIVAILGTAEEDEWDGMIRYVKTSTKPDHVISIDASYPVVIAESGFVAWSLALPVEGPRSLEPGERPRIERVEAGQFLTQVPGEASMAVLPSRGQSHEDLRDELEARGRAESQRLGAGFQLEVRVAGPRVHVTARGHAVHSSEADRGLNALWLLARTASRLDPELNSAALMLRLVDEFFVEDHFARKLGIAHEDPVMGLLLAAPTLLHTGDDSITLGINMRRPAGKTKAEMEGLLDGAFERMVARAPGLRTQERWVGEPALADTSGPLVPTLLRIYRAVTGDQVSEPVSIRGGTYARLFPGAVSFGPSMPGAGYAGHAPDEHIELRVLKQMLQMIFESALALTAPP